MSKVTVSNTIAYIQGKLRYKLYYSYYNFLIPTHIKEQIDYRIRVMDKECFNNGACKICGCETTALQMANKACPKPCYPKMLNRKNWNKQKKFKNYDKMEKQ